MSIPKYSKSKSLSSLESFEGPPVGSDKLLAGGALDPIDDTRDPEAAEEERGIDPEATEDERGTDPEREPKEAER